MEPNTDPLNTNNDSSNETPPADPYGQAPPQPDVDQLTSLKVDLSDAPQPGISFTPSSNEPANTSTNGTLPTDQNAQLSSETTSQTPTEQPITQQAPAIAEPPAMPAVVVSNHAEQTVAQGAPASGVQNAPNMPSINKKKISIKIPLKAALIAVITLFVLGGGFAAAYVGIILPNDPNNVLKQAIVNSIEESNVSANGSLQVSANGSTTRAYKVYINGATNRTAKTADVTVNLTTAGITFPVELRLVDGNIYFKFGDLSEIASLLGMLSPSYAGDVQSLSSQLSNKWISIDSTLVDQSGMSCFLNAGWNLNNSDINMLESLYNSSAFMHINSTSNTTLNGQNTEDFNVTLNDNKLASFAKGLNKLSIVTELEKCSKSSGGSGGLPNFSSLADNSTTPLNILVNKSTKQIVQITSSSTAGDLTKGISGSLSMNFSYKPVNIAAPANAEPALQVYSSILTQLEQSSGAGNAGSSSSSLGQLFNSFGQ